ncbi:MAG: S8 family serine peptidase [Thaumarchaeota archaeon]|nr:S8 family serine peptidase [Nitrososphaerota archaeon]
MPKLAFFLILILLVSVFAKVSYGFYDVDLMQSTPQLNLENSDIIKISPTITENQIKRYVVFGSGSISDVRSSAQNLVYGIISDKGFFSVGTFYQNNISDLQSKGYTVIEDFQLEFDSIPKSLNNKTASDASRIGLITGSDEVFRKYGFDGKGITIGIVDTGTDFSNPDVRDSLARDQNNHPIMIDADGQGLVLTNATFVAKINDKGVITNYTKPIPKNITSSVYVDSKGVFLNLVKKGNGTAILVFNSLFPSGGSPVLNGTISNDMKIGKNNKDFLVSKSGIYHLGVIYQGVLQGPSTRLQLVPVLVLDSKIAGLYDTVIPDMSTSWIDFTRFEAKDNKPPKYDFDFTDETPITLGNGKEFFLYDSDKDGKFDYSAGTFGAQVLDIYGVIKKRSFIESKIRATNGTLLSPLDPKGNYFGVMYDFAGHGTSTAASITSKGIEKYDIYGNSTKYSIKGVAPGAKIVPIKALWFGDAVYAWLWASGFHQEHNNWVFEGKPRVDIISNSWGISNFPTLQSASGLDVLSLVLGTLTVPGSIDKNYPGVLIVSSAGNAGHGYGTLGLPNSSPFSLSVGATTNNVYVGYGPFKNQPRFGNTTSSSNEIADFSSRGPGIIGDPKPDLMSIGAYSFTPTSVTKKSKNATDPFAMFGGTSMAAPLVSGSAAILMESLKQQNKEYDPFSLKNILMSTATDLENDPFTQGAGIVNVESAVNFVEGKSGTFIVYNNASYNNIKKILDVPMNTINSSSFGIENFHLSNASIPMTPWFGGRLHPGERTFATFTIENPTNRTLDITIKPQILELVKKYQYNDTTEMRLQDPLINKSGTFRPNYIPLGNIAKDEEMNAFFGKKKPIPNDASLMIINVNFPFDNFMNKTEKIYANDMKISSLYLYDWYDKNNDTKVTYDELSLVNRGGSWGTVQELRVTEPNSKFKNTPLVGVYPVPTKYSYWIGDTKKNSTSMDYTVTTSFYKKENWESVWVNYDNIQVAPNSSSDLVTTLIVPQDYKPGVYQGFISFHGNLHEVNVPVSYAVTKGVAGKDLPTVIEGSQKDDALYGNGYIGGAFDMTNRYNAGDWRQYYFDVQDKTINSAALNISWENKDTNLSVFVIDPAGKIIQTNVPPGVLGHFQGWPTGDWLGTSPFSEGGGFFPIKNKDDTSTVLYAPINQTGTYSVLMHSTLFGGQSIAEPITMTAKFSTILPDEKDPQILFIVPEFINSTYKIHPEIMEENIDTVKYSLDGNEIQINAESQIPPNLLTEGLHNLKVSVTDTVGHRAEKDVEFKVDNKPPELLIKSPTNGSVVSNIISIDVDVSEQNLPETGGIRIMLPNGTMFDSKFVQLDTRTLENGKYDIQILAKDMAGNEISKKIVVNIDNRPFFENPKGMFDQNFILLQGIIIGIIIATITILIAKKTKISKNH